MKESILAHGTRDKGDEEEGKNLSRIALRQIELLWGKLLWFNFRPIHLRMLTLIDPYQVSFWGWLGHFLLGFEFIRFPSFLYSRNSSAYILYLFHT